MSYGGAPTTKNEALQGNFSPSASAHDDWSKRLVGIQHHHQRESIQQQREHLQQLHHLQEQLLKEISFNMSKEAAVGGGGGAINTAGGGVVQGQSSSGGVASSPIRQDDTSSTVLLGLEHSGVGRLPTPSSPVGKESRQPFSPTGAGSGQVLPSADVTPVKVVVRSLRSTSDKPLADHAPYVNSPLLSHATKSGVYETSPTQNHTHYVSSPPSRTPLLHSQQASFLTPSITTTQTPSSSSRHAGLGLVGAGPRSHDQTRTSLLLEKHSKHVEDLKQYYEAEIAALTVRLCNAEQHSSVMKATTTTAATAAIAARRSLSFDELSPSRASTITTAAWERGKTAESASLDKMAADRIAALKAENSRLEMECTRLQKQLEEKNRQCSELSEQEREAESQVLEWQEHCVSTEKLTAALKERLEAARQELKEQGTLKEELRSDLLATREELKTFKIRSKQDQYKIDELFSNFEELQVENATLHEANSKQEVDVKNSNSEVASLKATVADSKTQEAKLKSTIHSLEEQVRHLEHLKNRAHNMGTHYTLSNGGSPEDKKRATPTHASKSPPPTTPTTTNTQHPPPPLNLTRPSSCTYRSSLPSSSEREQRQTSSTPTPEKPMTRRKWLESSDPGLFGVTLANYNRKGDEGGSPKPNREQRSMNSEVELDPLASSALRAIKDGKVITQDGRQQLCREQKNLEEMLRKRAYLISDAEHKLDRLLGEKESLESALQRTPKIGLKTSREAKKIQIDKEVRLEEVMQEIGSVRMVLRQNHALGNHRS